MELQLKNPDALLNEAVANLIRSCVPNVKDPKALFSATFITLYKKGTSEDWLINAECPKCQTVTDVSISVESLAKMGVGEYNGYFKRS